MIIGHGRVIQIGILTHLGGEVYFLVNAVKAQRSHSGYDQYLICNVFISLLIDDLPPRVVPIFRLVFG